MFKKLNKAIGEAVLISPLFIISIFIDLWSECALIIALLFLYKSAYPVQYHSQKNIVCVGISYGAVIIGLIIAYVFKREYIIIILSYNIVAYASARIGYLQRKAEKYELIAEPYSELVKFYNSVTAFNPETATEAELVERCRRCGLSAENTALAVEFFIKKTPHKILADRYSWQIGTAAIKKQRMKKLLTAKLYNDII